MSEEDIASGVRWLDSIAVELSVSSFGIIVLTLENQTKPWLIFEAGALSRTVPENRVVPLLVDFKTQSDLLPPLSQFQARLLNAEQLRRLLADINDERGDARLEGDQLSRTLDKWVPDLLKAIDNDKASLHSLPTSASPHRSQSDVLDDVLMEIRSVQRDVRDGFKKLSERVLALEDEFEVAASAARRRKVATRIQPTLFQSAPTRTLALEDHLEMLIYDRMAGGVPLQVATQKLIEAVQDGSVRASDGVTAEMIQQASERIEAWRRKYGGSAF